METGASDYPEHSSTEQQDQMPLATGQIAEVEVKRAGFLVGGNVKAVHDVGNPHPYISSTCSRDDSKAKKAEVVS